MPKLLFQSDDYGITKAVSAGIIEGIKNGIIRNTGIFTNMPWAAEVAAWIKPYLPEIALGIDLNLSTGPALLPSEEIPSLVQEGGRTFFTSRQNRLLDEQAANRDHVVYEEAYKEFDTQIQKYIQLFDRKPDYLHRHAYSTPTVEKARQDLVEKYDILYSTNVADWEDCNDIPMGQYVYPSTVENQLQVNTAQYLMSEKANVVHTKKEFSFFITHCGYVDQELFDLSSFNICRMKDLAAACSEDVRSWIEENRIELITYRELGK